jgi:aminoglycoside 6'-N-acetyltransferase I
MRVCLYPRDDPSELSLEMDKLVVDDSWAVFVAEAAPNRLCGFVEVSFRSRAEGCESGAVGYIGSLYVDPDLRRQGIGRSLLLAAEEWASRRGAMEMSSDCGINNEISQSVHRNAGYVECSRLVHLRKDLRRTLM